MSLRTAVPGERPEPFLTRAQLAEIIGVSTDTVDRMRQRGMPSETWSARSVRFRFSDVEAWHRDRADARAPRHAE
jgi:predicted DNA-binding transcriptional regulator AlpA